MEKIAITGGSGFIGTNLIDGLVQNGYQVVNLDVAEPRKKEHAQYWRRGDILNKQELKTLLEEFDPEVIIHLAAVTDLNGTELSYYAANIAGTQNLIDITRQMPRLNRVIFCSSMYVSKPGIIPPDYRTYAPHTVYGQSKVDGELLVIKAHLPYQWVIVRPTSIWGPWFDIPYIDFFRTVHRKRYVKFSKACIKTYGYVENTVFQLIALINAPGVEKKTFYLGDLPPTNIGEWGGEISQLMGKGEIKKVSYFILKSIALVGDVLTFFKLKFPLTSFRLTNMTTNNVLPLDDIYAVAGAVPVTRKDGAIRTIKWMQQNNKF